MECLRAGPRREGDDVPFVVLSTGWMKRRRMVVCTSGYVFYWSKSAMSWVPVDAIGDDGEIRTPPRHSVPISEFLGWRFAHVKPGPACKELSKYVPMYPSMRHMRVAVSLVGRPNALQSAWTGAGLDVLGPLGHVSQRRERAFDMPADRQLLLEWIERRLGDRMGSRASCKGL